MRDKLDVGNFQFMKLDVAITDLKQQGMSRLIIDLRRNIGGDLGLARLASYRCPGQIQIGYSLSLSGAEGGTRTPTVLRPSAPQAGASANSATSAREGGLRHQFSVVVCQPMPPHPALEGSLLITDY